MKIEDLKPGDRLWVDDREVGDAEPIWEAAKYLGDGMALDLNNRKYFWDLERSAFKKRNLLSPWEKIVDLFFKRK